MVTAVQDTIDDDERDGASFTATHNGGNTIGSQQTVTITDDDDAPTLSVAVGPATIAEAAGTSTVTVSTGGSTLTRRPDDHPDACRHGHEDRRLHHQLRSR